MNVLHVIRDLNITSGGPSRSVSMTVHCLSQDAGINASLFYANPDDNAYYSTKLSELKRFETDHNKPTNFRSIAGQLKKIVEKESTDIIHVHGIWSPLVHYACRFARERGLPYVIAPRGMLEPWALRQKRLKKRIALWWFQRKDLDLAHCIHTTADSEAKNVRELGIKSRIEVIPNGTEIPNSLSEKHVKEKRRVLFLSRIHPKKGLMDLIAAWNQTRPVGWECVIAGTDEDGYASDVLNAIRKNGLEDKIRLHPSVDGKDKWDLYRSADIFVLPSHSENFGLVVAEALASGVPVITTIQTPWEELISHGCGWWIQDNPVALAQILAKATAIEDLELREMGARGRALIQSKYTWPAVASKLANLYRDLLNDSNQ